jgi:hypothetical protein
MTKVADTTIDPEVKDTQAEETVDSAEQPTTEVQNQEDEILDDELDGLVASPSFISVNSKAEQETVEKEAVDRSELERLRQVEQDYLALASDPLVEAAFNFRKAGNSDIMQFVTELTGGYKDVSRMSMDEMYEQHYRSSIAKRYALSEDDIEEALDEFRSKSPAQKAQIIDPIRERLEQESKNSIKSLSEKFSSKAKEDEKSIIEFQEREKKALNYLDNKLNELTGKTMHRVQVTPEIAKEIRDLSTQFAIRNPETLEADVDATISMWMWLRHGDKILKQHIRYGQNRGLETSVIGRSNGNASPIKTNGISPSSTSDKYQELIKKSGGKLPRTGSSTPN